MAANEKQIGVTFSLLDRLTDLAPDSKQEARSNSWEEDREFKALLCRDLAVLLNTRRAEEDFPPTFEEATNSLLSFGVTDFTSYDLKSGVEQERVRRSIERAIRQFEPRLTKVTVSMEAIDHLRPVLRFQIAAQLRMNPVEDVFFDATLQRDTRRIAVAGAGS
jgi:type VI secretion system protein ImpF